MAGIVQYAGVNAKVKAIIGKMLSKEDYQQLVAMDSVQEVFDYLYEQTHYREYLKEYAGQEIHRRTFERLLKTSVVDDYKVIHLYLKGSSRKFLEVFFSRYEIEDLKMVLRTILIGHDEDYLRKNLLYLGLHCEIPLETLTQVENYKDVMDVYSETSYYPILKRFEERYRRDRNLFPVEMSLDFAYFTNLAKAARRLNRSDYQTMKELLGTLIDLLNISWLYRIKRFYNLAQEETYNYILPYSHGLTTAHLREMSKVEDAEEIFTHLADTRYHQIFAKSDVKEHDSFEGQFLTYLLGKARQAIRMGSFNLGVIIGYLFLKEFEIRDLITIAEGVRYQLSEEKIRDFLIHDGI